jgi:hypothetical protein
MEYKIIFLLLLLPIVSATPILELQHESIQPGETILATITTPEEFTQKIEESQIKFFEGRKQLTLETDILFYNETHYLSIYTLDTANITLQIENILYQEAGILQSTTITKNLTIQENILTNEETNETYTQILRIKPGYIFSSTTPKLKLTNMGTKGLNLTLNEEQISIESLAAQDIEFTPQETFSLTKISTYKDFLIPTVYLAATENITENETENITTTPEADLRHSPSLLLVETFTNTESQETIELFNFGDNNITNLEITSSLDFITLEDLQDMPGRGTQNLTLSIEAKTSGHFQGTINISYIQNETENKLEIPLSIFILPQGSPVENFQVKEETCEQISGQVCGGGTFCNGTTTFTKNLETCCLNSCVQEKPEEKEGGGSGWLIAIAIFAILGFTGYYFYKKQKELESPKSKDVLTSRTEKFEKRLTGNKPQRTTGTLTKS